MTEKEVQKLLKRWSGSVCKTLSLDTTEVEKQRHSAIVSDTEVRILSWLNSLNREVEVVGSSARAANEVMRSPQLMFVPTLQLLCPSVNTLQKNSRN